MEGCAILVNYSLAAKGLKWLPNFYSRMIGDWFFQSPVHSVEEVKDIAFCPQ